jgi:toxin-antitoxin system PIN domain toxin
VIAVDTNILVYAHRGDSPFHPAAAACVRSVAEGKATWCLLWQCVHEFLGVVTHPRIYDPPSPVEVALAQVEAWLESPTVVLLGEADGYWSTLRDQVTAGHVVGPRIHDARIAALCVAHSVTELWSADRDFSRFADLAVRNPLGDFA